MDELASLRIADEAVRCFVIKNGVPLKEVAERAEIPASCCLDWWSSTARVLDSEKIENFTDSFRQTIPSFVSRDASGAVTKGESMSTDVLPERYAHCALSYTFSSRHILATIELQYGRLVAHHLLAKLMVPYQYFQSLGNRISIKFFEDLLAEYIKMGNPLEQFDYLSKALFLTVEDSHMKLKFPRVHSYSEAFSIIQQSTKYFDENFDYQFSIGARGVEIRCRPSEELSAGMKAPKYGSALLYKYRSTLFGNMVRLCGLEPIKMTTQKCVSNGDLESVYSANF